MLKNPKFSYKALGITIKSENMEIPELLEVEDQPHSLLLISLKIVRLFRQNYQNFTENFCLKKQIICYAHR